MLQSENASIMQRLAKYIVHVFRARVDHDTVNIVIPSTCISIITRLNYVSVLISMVN